MARTIDLAHPSAADEFRHFQRTKLCADCECQSVFLQPKKERVFYIWVVKRNRSVHARLGAAIFLFTWFSCRDRIGTHEKTANRSSSSSGVDTMILRKLVFAICPILSITPIAYSATCETLQSLSLAHTTITLAQSVVAGEFSPPSRGDRGTIQNTAFKDLPAFCRIAATLKPSTVQHKNGALAAPDKMEWEVSGCR